MWAGTLIVHSLEGQSKKLGSIVGLIYKDILCKKVPQAHLTGEFAENKWQEKGRSREEHSKPRHDNRLKAKVGH